MSRIYLKSTVLLTVFFLFCLATLALAQEPCGSWSFAGWIQSGTVQWTTDGNGDPSPSVEGDAVEEATWSDPCEGTTKDPQTASHGYSLVSDQVVYDDGDGQYYREVTYSASSSFGGPDNVITGRHVLARHWSSSPAITGGEKETPQSGMLTVLPGETVTLSVTEAADEDTWTMAGVGSGTAPDTISYAWTGDGTFPDDTNTRSIQWQAPQDVGTYTVTVTIDDAPAQVTAPDTGSRDDSSLSQSFTIKVAPKVWDTDLAIGNARQEDGTSIKNGRMISPQDQRQDPASPEKVTIQDGGTLNCEVEAATDSDHWKQNGDQGIEEGYDNDDLTYTWSATGGTITPDPTDPKKATWTAPDDDGTYTIKCTIDDVPKAIGANDGGSRDDSQVIRQVDVEVKPFDITWEGLARACAGGIGLDGVHDFTITGTAKRPDGTLVTGAELELSFEGNKGHDYSSDPEGIKPDGWTSADTKKAKFVTTDDQGQTALVEEMNLTTDAEGKISVHVLSSDIISSDIKIKVKWKDEHGKEHDVGEKACDFAEAISIRRFPNWIDPDETEDTGWLFGQQWLNAPNTETTAKVYVKFMIDPSIGDVDGNWKEVNGHNMFFKIDSVTPREGTTVSNNLNDYATLVANSPDGATIYQTVAGANGSAGGAATATVRAGDMIADANTIWVIAYDLSQWEK